VNKTKWKVPAKTLAKNPDESLEVSSGSAKPEDPGLAVPDYPAGSGCYHACRLCVPNHPPISGFDPAIIGHSDLNLKLSDITDRRDDEPMFLFCN
jgi:hypothetical protein